MLPQAEILQTIAEVAVAIAGFAALAGAFGATRLEAQDLASALSSLRLVAVSGFFMLTSALIPLVVSDYGLSASATWRLSGSFVYAINVYALVSLLVRDGTDSRQVSGWRLYPVAMALEVVGHAALLSIIFGVFEESASALYLTFLVARVFQGALLFLRFFEFVFTRKST